MTPRHPCGGLPVSGFHISQWYCHHHQAWFGSAEVHVQTDDDVNVVYDRHMEFGPFDSADDVQRWTIERLPALVRMVMERL